MAKLVSRHRKNIITERKRRNIMKKKSCPIRNYNTAANVSKRFFEEMAKIEAEYREEGYPADIRTDNAILALYDRYERKYGTGWF